MNERIKQLAEQAGAIEAKDITNIPRALSLNGEEIEMFAQLIVRECIGVADHSNATGKSIIGERIKQHFGVKE